MTTSSPPRWLGLVTTEPGAGTTFRWLSRERSLNAFPPTLADLRVRDLACAAVDASELECVLIEQPFKPREHEVIPNGALRFEVPAGGLDDVEAGSEHALAARLVFASPDGAVAVEGEDYEILRSATLRAVIVRDAEEPTVTPDSDEVT